MTCEDCNKATDIFGGQMNVAFYRIGNKEIGYASIGLLGCLKHVKLALDRLNEASKDE